MDEEMQGPECQMPTTAVVAITDPSYTTMAIHDLPVRVAQYVSGLETGETVIKCRCLWRIHPDDLEKPEGKRRKVLVDQAEDCPVHTKEGLILGFFRWLQEGGEQTQMSLFPMFTQPEIDCD